MSFIKDMKSVLTLTVIVAGLGYFVDLFDITLFAVVRVSSLKDLGITDPQAILQKGLFIYNSQMIGMMIGGLLWGILADKRGRLSVMFASILIYSFANILNAFATDPYFYAACRFIGGLGLAGELGAAVTLVAESLPKDKRGLGTTIVATLGMLGILAASVVGQHVPWKMAYLAGGVMGIGLLFTRLKVSESSMFRHTTSGATQRGNFFMLLRGRNLTKYVACILIGIPIYFTTGILFTFAPELTAGLHVQGTVSAGNAILFGSIGLAGGDLLSGLFSQWLRSRRKAIALMIVAGGCLMLVYGFASGLTSQMIYVLSLLIGTCVGYWAVLITMAAEQFGTNIRGTVATTVPNFVRGSAALVASGFAMLKAPFGVSTAAMAVGSACFGLALFSVSLIDETFSKDLNYEEPSS